MNHIWQASPEERLKYWRDFRKELEHLDDLECLQAVVDWWKMAPLSTRSIDPYYSDEWPDPWQLLYEGDFDENSIALGMAYTLHLMEWPCHIKLVQDINQSFLGLVVIVDDKHVLNYNYGSVDDHSVLTNSVVLESWPTEKLT